MGSYVGTGNPYIFTPFVGSSIYFVYMRLSGCDGTVDSIASNVINMDVLHSPQAGVIVGLDSICVGSMIVLSDTASGGTWSADNTNASVAGAVVNGINPGVDTILYTVANSCGIDTASYVINIKSIPHPALNNSPCCSVSGDYLSYQWYEAELPTLIAGATNSSYTCGMGAWYVVVDSGGCIGRSDTVWVAEGVAKISSVGSTFIIYPNPATTQLTIQSTGQPINEITITNLLGQKVYTRNYGTEKVQVDVSGLPAGVYFIKINGTEVRKFVKN